MTQTKGMSTLLRRLIVALMAIACAFALAACAGSNPSQSSTQSAEGVAQEEAAEEAAEEAEEEETLPLDEYTWAELSQISSEVGAAGSESAAIEIAKKYNLCTPSGKLDGTQAKSVTLSDGTETSVQIVGFAHDDKTAGGKAGITFIFKDIIKKGRMNDKDTSSGGWKSSLMRTDVEQMKSSLPKDLQEAIVPVDKLSNNVGASKDASSVSATSDSLWLFSFIELGGDPGNSSVLPAQGSVYKMFADMREDAGDDSNKRDAIYSKTWKGEDCNWWERTVHDEEGFYNVTWAPGNYDEATDSLGVVPGFCI